MDAVKDSLTQGYNTAKCPLSTAPPNDAYLHWDALGVEVIEPDQEAKSQQIADTINKMQKRYFDKVRPPPTLPYITSSYSVQPALTKSTSTATPCATHVKTQSLARNPPVSKLMAQTNSKLLQIVLHQ